MCGHSVGGVGVLELGLEGLQVRTCVGEAVIEFEIVHAGHLGQGLLVVQVVVGLRGRVLHGRISVAVDGGTIVELGVVGWNIGVFVIAVAVHRLEGIAGRHWRWGGLCADG